MDPERFDDIVRGAIESGSRRALLRIVTAGLVTSVGGILATTAEASETTAEFYGLCRFPTQSCKRDSQCCSHRCVDGACTCKKKGARCFSPAGIICCSRRCNRGVCK